MRQYDDDVRALSLHLRCPLRGGGCGVLKLEVAADGCLVPGTHARGDNANNADLDLFTVHGFGEHFVGLVGGLTGLDVDNVCAEQRHIEIVNVLRRCLESVVEFVVADHTRVVT